MRCLQSLRVMAWLGLVAPLAANAADKPEIGGALGVSLVAVPSVGAVGDRYVIDLKLFDETDVDCGGADCRRCPLAAGCLGDADSPHVIFHNLSGSAFATTPEDGRWVAGGHIGVLGTEAAVIWDGTGSGGTPCTTDTPTACETIVYMDADITISSLAFSPQS